MLENGPGVSPPPRPTIFVSYSHQDEAWKDQVIGHLSVLEPEGFLEVWHDREIPGGADWHRQIQNAMKRAAVAVLLISKDFLTSDFILKVEVPYLLERRNIENIHIIPVIIHPCAWTAVRWLNSIQCRPKDGRPISTGSVGKADEDLAELTLEIRRLLDGPSSKGDLPLLSPHIDLGQLPTTSPHFVGRDIELGRINVSWEDPRVHILTIVAFGGVGKSTLVSRWLDHMATQNWLGARKVLVWSFYSQGSEEQASYADSFMDHAFNFFGIPNSKSGSARERGIRLAESIRKEKTLLVLDGLEPLQYTTEALTGRLKDPGILALLRSLAAANSGLCLVTTRERIADLEAFSESAPQIKLQDLTPEAGAELLLKLGVVGSDFDLQTVSREMAGHALAITLLGKYLYNSYGGDVRRWKDLDLSHVDERQGGPALRIIESYTRSLGDRPELGALLLLGFFDSPADAGSLAALRAKPAIKGLTNLLLKRTSFWRQKPISEEDWNWAVSSLRENGLVLPMSSNQKNVVDVHPIVRAYLKKRLQDRPTVWQQGNQRLFEYFKYIAPEYPETLEAMALLYSAMIYGCRAGKFNEVLRDIYVPRIHRGESYFSWHNLGAFGSEITALSAFFDQPWDKVTPNLTESDQAFILNEASFCLRTIGRLTEAVPPLLESLRKCIRLGHRKQAAVRASNLSQLKLILGEIDDALTRGDQSIDLAVQSGNDHQTIINLTTLADALTQAGRFEESANIFRKAEELQVRTEPDLPKLYAAKGYRYCELLLSNTEPVDGSGLDTITSQEECRRLYKEFLSVRDRAEWALSVANDNGWALMAALDNLTLGRTHLRLALIHSAAAISIGITTDELFSLASSYIERSLDGLRIARVEEYFARALIERAALHRFRGELFPARVDIEEVLEIAERSSMRLHTCDAELEWTRICLKQEDTGAARQHFERAKTLIKKTNYGRRKREAAYLEIILS